MDVEKRVIYNRIDREFRWISGKKRYKALQIQGIDIVLEQDDVFYNPYSNPAHELYTCLLRYLHEKDAYPDIKDLTTIEGEEIRETEGCELWSAGFRPKRTLIRSYLNQRLPYFQDGKIRITSYNTGDIGSNLKPETFIGYVHENEFAIGIETNEEGIDAVLALEEAEKDFLKVKPIITFNKDDVLITARAIYCFSTWKKTLTEVYEAGLTLSTQ